MTALVGGLLLAELASVTASAQADAWTLARGVVAGGGGTSASNQLTVTGTVGQPTVGTHTGSVSTLSSGFWAGGIRTVWLTIDVPLVLGP